MYQYNGIEDSELEARFDDLYRRIMAAFDSLPLATWTPEYRAAKRDIQVTEVEFRSVGIELARRLADRTSVIKDLNVHTARGIVGRLVEDVHDDSACPGVGLVIGVIDEETVEVVWGDRRLEENPGPGHHEPIDAIRPARDGVR